MTGPSEVPSEPGQGGLAWRALLREAEDRCRAAGLPHPEVDARCLVERASGSEGGLFAAGLDDPATERGVAFFDVMLQRRLTGEPLQYVVGRWGFRTLDLFVDRRVLIPRPETEQVVEAALGEAACRPRPLVLVDLGTGSGAIALSLAAELRGDVEVWATDASPRALEVASANLAGIGRGATRVRLAEGSWFGALPAHLRGRVDLVVANPPYVAAGEVLPAEVADWEPAEALVAGPTGLECIEAILAAAPGWISPGGAAVLEIGDTQGGAATALARAAGFERVEVRPDLAGRDRILVAT
ncbi:MAG: peptide chain release factor N(5)-glutamine methyltransferase [Acidimicrobiales bacterium]|nr:peptide chain release factor N(5)-glutamine methyltransferase [Acidimicrobiales bacterium]